jgi:hypothetical protein
MDAPVVADDVSLLIADSISTSTARQSQSCMNTIPRLVSVVEIVKRQFLDAKADLHSGSRPGALQYNYVGCLEDLRPEPEAVQLPRAIFVQDLLQGKNQYVWTVKQLYLCA